MKKTGGYGSVPISSSTVQLHFTALSSIMKLLPSMYVIRILLASYYLQRQRVAAQSGTCREERSQRGFALLNTSYSSVEAQRYSDCVNLCFYDPRCMSFNFWWDKRKCDLNSKAREHSCRSCFATEASSTYMGMARFPGYPGK